jgi:hypothetical protein
VVNATDGVGLLSGTPPAEYSDGKNKIQHGIDYTNQIAAQGYTPKLPPMDAIHVENMGVLLYGPGASNNLSQQYYRLLQAALPMF